MPPNTTSSSGQTRGKSGRKKGRRTRLILIVLVLAIIGGVGYGAFWSISTVRASFPQTKGSIELDGLSGPVDVKRDGNGPRRWSRSWPGWRWWWRGLGWRPGRCRNGCMPG